MKYGDWTLGQTEALINKLGGMDVAMNILRGTVEVVTKVIYFITATYTVPVDYGRSITDSVRAGNYNWSNSNVNDRNFPSTETVTADVSMALFHFNRDISSEKAIEEMKNAGYRPATMKEILAFGEKNPEVQREFPIVALGSSVRLSGGLRVGCLFRYDSGRGLDLRYLESVWLDYCRFLAVRNN